MLINGPSADQVRNAAGCSFGEAQVACYMAGFAAEGRTLCDFMGRGRMDERSARDFAYRFGIVFPDYDPFAKPKRLEWRKAKVGWDLLDGEEVIGECRRQPDGRYEARLYSATSETGWNARLVMRLISEALDTMSRDTPGFDGAPVKSVVTNANGLVGEVLFPADDEDLRRCRDALHFRTTMKLGEAA